jgi:hypothetical protein
MFTLQVYDLASHLLVLPVPRRSPIDGTLQTLTTV